jgi:hypothetical protein
MGMSNPAVSRLTQTWEVSHDDYYSVKLLRNYSFSIRPLKTKALKPFSFCWQKLPSKFKKFYAEFESMMVSCSSKTDFHLTPEVDSEVIDL